jgi:hypothetical protein
LDLQEKQVNLVRGEGLKDLKDQREQEGLIKEKQDLLDLQDRQEILDRLEFSSLETPDLLGLVTQIQDPQVILVILDVQDLQVQHRL